MEEKNESTITNEKLYAKVEAGLDRIENGIIDQLLLSDDELLLDDILDEIQMAIQRTETEKKIYYSWIFKHELPDDLIWIPEGDDVIEDEDSEDEDY